MKPWTKRFHILIDDTIMKLSTFVLSQNPDDIETALRLGFCKREKIGLLGNGIDLKKFFPNRFDDGFKLKKRNEIGVPANAVVVAIIGRLIKRKGYIELLEAMQQVIAQNKNVWLIIIGPEEPERPGCISPNTFREYGISDHIRYLGSRDDIDELLACCDIYTLPSWLEGIPRSAIEASAMGLPIVVTDISSCRQVVEDGITGFLVPLRNPAQLRDAIIRLVENASLRHKMGQAGFDKARREFDEEKVCRIVIDTYKKLLESKKLKPEAEYP
jgi:glycosyltransferase involved in cell wall biosynthesis